MVFRFGAGNGFIKLARVGKQRNIFMIFKGPRRTG